MQDEKAGKVKIIIINIIYKFNYNYLIYRWLMKTKMKKRVSVKIINKMKIWINWKKN